MESLPIAGLDPSQVFSFEGPNPGDRERVLALTYPTGRNSGNVALIFSTRDEEYHIFADFQRNFKRSLKEAHKGESWTITLYPHLRLERDGNDWMLITHRGVVLYKRDVKPDEGLVRLLVEEHNDGLGREEFHFLTTVNTQHMF